MGMCPLEPEQRAINKKNNALKEYMAEEVQALAMYSFSKPLKETISNLAPRYLFNEWMIQDIDKIKLTAPDGPMNLSQDRVMSVDENLDQEVKQSCLILEDHQANLEIQAADSQSFRENIGNNQSLIVQISILYGKEIDTAQYTSSLKMFLKWVHVFHEHSYGGFLKPVYRTFCNQLYKIPKEDMENIVDQTNVFVQMMVKVYSEVYGLKCLNARENGKLFKNQNVFNLVMSYIFRRTKIKAFLRLVLKAKNHEKIAKFSQKLIQNRHKTALQIGVGIKFTLQNQSPLKNDRQLNKSQYEDSSKQLSQPNIPQTKPIYEECIKMTDELCSQSQTPVTKLKLIIKIAKQIMLSVQTHYADRQMSTPQIDPDSLMSIIMYIIIKCGNPTLLEEIKLVESFTTTNCLNCISGYYLNMFLAAIQTITDS